ncbi:hemerythrin domain-containing protein [Nitrospira sp. Nam74]
MGLQVLQDDHQHVTLLMHRIKAEFGKAESSARLELFQQLKEALLLHARVEELHVYPVFQQSETTRDSARQALEDHRAMKELLEGLAGMPPSGFQWVAKFNDLYERATRHMKMEEEELFGHAREVMTQQETEELGTKVEMAKKELRGEAPAPAGGIPE